MSTELAVQGPDPEPTLEELAVTLVREVTLAQQAFRLGLEHALVAGETLVAARRICPRNEWVEWVESKFPGRYSTAMVYLRIAMYKDEILANPEINSVNLAHKWLRTNKRRVGQSRRLEPCVDDEIQRLRDHGYKPQQIADRAGVSYSYVWFRLNPEAKAARRRKAQQEAARKKAAEEALAREERRRAIKRVGGAIAESYALARQLLQTLERAAEQESDREAKAALRNAMQRFYEGEDEIVKASKLSGVRSDVRAA